MVRVNLIEPKFLSDQHLIAEYNEILMLLGYVRKYPSLEIIPKKYVLGKGHIKFFKDKLIYLKKRHQKIRSEMNRRGFAVRKIVDLREFPKNLKNDWIPDEKDKKIIKQRLKERILKKQGFYRYYRDKPGKDFLLNLIDKSK